MREGAWPSFKGPRAGWIVSSGLLLSLKSQGGGGLNPQTDQSMPCSSGLLAESQSSSAQHLGMRRQDTREQAYVTHLTPSPSNPASQHPPGSW